MEKTLEVAHDLLQSILEQHLFLFADPLDEPLVPTRDIAYLKVKMGFSGDLNGRFVMLFPEDTSKEVIGNFLGLGPEAPEFLTMTSIDAATEIMNIVGGNIVSRLLEEKGNYELELPCTEKFDPIDWQALADLNHLISFQIEGRAMFFQVIVF